MSTANGVAGQQKILLVEDDVVISQMYQVYLTNNGYTVATAADGDQALLAAKAFHPDLILLDIMIPKKTGIEVTKWLRRDPAYGCQKCKIVLLTNLGDSSIAKDVESYIDGYAIKAEIRLQDLISIIKSFDHPPQKVSAALGEQH